MNKDAEDVLLNKLIATSGWIRRAREDVEKDVPPPITYPVFVSAQDSGVSETTGY